MTNLSPAAQAVLDELHYQFYRVYPTHIVGAVYALRAAADQVAPSDAVEPRNYIPIAIECQRIRAELLAIADELESAS